MQLLRRKRCKGRIGGWRALGSAASGNIEEVIGRIQRSLARGGKQEMAGAVRGERTKNMLSSGRLVSWQRGSTLGLG